MCSEDAALLRITSVQFSGAGLESQDTFFASIVEVRRCPAWQYKATGVVMDGAGGRLLKSEITCFHSDWSDFSLCFPSLVQMV